MENIIKILFANVSVDIKNFIIAAVLGFGGYAVKQLWPLIYAWVGAHVHNAILLWLLAIAKGLVPEYEDGLTAGTDKRQAAITDMNNILSKYKWLSARITDADVIGVINLAVSWLKTESGLEVKTKKVVETPAPASTPATQVQNG